jgi:hypothetical protein
MQGTYLSRTMLVWLAFFTVVLLRLDAPAQPSSDPSPSVKVTAPDGASA